jgi:hypothetical protein
LRAASAVGGKEVTEVLDALDVREQHGLIGEADARLADERDCGEVRDAEPDDGGERLAGLVLRAHGDLLRIAGCRESFLLAQKLDVDAVRGRAAHEPFADGLQVAIEHRSRSTPASARRQRHLGRHTQLAAVVGAQRRLTDEHAAAEHAEQPRPITSARGG